MFLALQLVESTLDWVKVTPIAISLLSLTVSGLSFWTAQTALKSGLYRDIDGLYMDFLKQGMANPKFVDPGKTTRYEQAFQDDERVKYELFAFCAWNICETIYDRRKNKSLFETWKPAIAHENGLHRAWFDNPQNRVKFKHAFYEYMSQNYPSPRVASGSEKSPRG